MGVWTGLLYKSVSRGEVRAYLDERLACYGPEEVVHDGLQLLNDTLNMMSRSEPNAVEWSRSAFHAWEIEAARFDENPEAWKRAWALHYLSKVLRGVRPDTGQRMLESMLYLITTEDAQALAEQFHLSSRSA
jgi:hypothetical protein